VSKKPPVKRRCANCGRLRICNPMCDICSAPSHRSRGRVVVSVEESDHRSARDEPSFDARAVAIAKSVAELIGLPYVAPYLWQYDDPDFGKARRVIRTRPTSDDLRYRGKVSGTTGPCPVCAEDRVYLTRHHLVPRASGKNRGATILLCYPCHDVAHYVWGPGHDYRGPSERSDFVASLQSRLNEWSKSSPSGDD